MGKYSIAEAESHFKELIAEAERGEKVVITRDGRGVARVEAVQPIMPSEPITDADLEWLAKRRKGRGRFTEDAGAFVSRMRDEDWAR